MKGFILVVLFAVILSIGSFYVFNKNQTKTSQKINRTKEIPASASLVTVKEFAMTAKKWQFSPQQIKVKQGERVKLRIKSVDIDHGFSLSAFGIDQNISSGKETVIEFVANKKGKFPFFCSVYCGEGHSSMTGELIVE